MQKYFYKVPIFICITISSILILSGCFAHQASNEKNTKPKDSTIPQSEALREPTNSKQATEEQENANAPAIPYDQITEEAAELILEPDLITHENTEYHYRIDLPSDWQKTERVDDTGYTLSSFSKYFDTITLTITDNSRTYKTIAEYRTTYINDTKLNLDISSLNSEELIRIHETDFIKLEAEKAWENSTFYIISYASLKNEKLYHILITVDKGLYEKSKAIFQKIEESITL